MTSLLWGRLYKYPCLFRLQYNCPVFPSNNQERQRSGQLFFGILIFFLLRWFVLSLGTLRWEINKYLIDGRNILIQSERSVRRLTDYSKKAPVLGSGFSLLPPQSPCGFSALARLYYLIAPNQNRHTTQATDEGKSKWVERMAYRKVFGPLSRPFRLSLAPPPPSKYLPLWVSEDELLPAFNGNGYVIWSWASINFLSCFNWWANNCVSGPITKHECWPLSSAVATSAENRCVSFIYFHIPSYLKEFLRETDRYNNFASWRKTFHKYKCAYYHPVAPGAD